LNDVKSSSGNGSLDPVALLDRYLDEAIERGATDLHFEPFSEALSVRIRMDGILHTIGSVSKSVSENVLCRLMVLAGLLTYRTDIPQEGRIKLNSEGGKNSPAWSRVNVGLRVATFPTVEGTRAVIRIIRGTEQFAGLESLGYPADCLEILSGLTRRKSGLILLTGPAGSGKTTTIYTFLRTIIKEQPGVSVISLEDPVEHRLDMVTQIQITPHGELTYQRSLRSLLRQDPQVLALGEIRDAETADICIEAALAGHLLISTIHSGTVAGAIVRLSEMGIPSYQLTSAIEAILAQRLVRRLCPHCRQKLESPVEPFRAMGCDQCGGTGYHGRTVIAEVGQMGGTFRAAVRKQADIPELEHALIEDGMVGLEAQAGALVAQGLTTVEEISMVLGRPVEQLRAGWSE
jgi:general secretion pathway protein E